MNFVAQISIDRVAYKDKGRESLTSFPPFKEPHVTNLTKNQNFRKDKKFLFFK